MRAVSLLGGFLMANRVGGKLSDARGTGKLNKVISSDQHDIDGAFAATYEDV